MPGTRTRRRVPHSAQDMFDLVAEVEHYPEFVPYCAEIIVHRRTTVSDAIETAEITMIVAYRFIRQPLTSRITFDRSRLMITIMSANPPLRTLESRWTFHAEGEDACIVEFEVSYAFRGRLFSAVVKAVFDRLFRHFVSAFERRADQMYGTRRRRVSARRARRA